LLRREEFVPEGVATLQGIADLGFREPLDVLPRYPPGGNDDLGRAEEDAELVDDGMLDLCRLYAVDWTAVGAMFEDGLANIVAVELLPRRSEP